jgi:hypothetical protein
VNVAIYYLRFSSFSYINNDHSESLKQEFYQMWYNWIETKGSGKLSFMLVLY